MLYDNIILLTDGDMDPICGPFLTLPTRKEYPDYYEDIEKPIALDKIRVKVIYSQKYFQFSFSNI
jgi:protein polybromo-1